MQLLLTMWSELGSWETKWWQIDRQGGKIRKKAGLILEKYSKHKPLTKKSKRDNFFTVHLDDDILSRLREVFFTYLT